MISAIKNPEWVDQRLVTHSTLNDLPPNVFQEIKAQLAGFRSAEPLVSIVIPAFNEEYAILRTLHSLSCNKTIYPVEIIVINNNSTDLTQRVLDELGVRSYFQPLAGWGPARQLGLEKAMGKYVLTADADCFYPPHWIDTMTNALMSEKVTCVYGGYSFLGTAERARWKFFIYESFRNVILEVRQVKRPYLNARGLNMGFVKSLGLKKGYINRKVRGEDGRMCFELMQHGKVTRLRSRKMAVWTPPRTLKADGGLLGSFLNNVWLEMSRFTGYFYRRPAHDTHASANDQPVASKYFRRVRNVAVEKETTVS